ncbi:MAG TPA: HD-GYP domain-containing protein [Candidatus Dormibacteraeota bacterium]
MVSHPVPQIKGWLDAVVVLGHMVKDRESLGHNRRVAQLCVQIGRELAMTTSELRVLARAGLLHDVGKLAIPDHILDKHAPLDESEWTLMKSHPEIGLSILGDRRSSRELLAVLYHHERLDGSGYPYGLDAAAIPIEARIVAVADTYDALTSNRPYRKARTQLEARRVVMEEAGRRLDHRVVSAMFAALDAHVTRAAESARRMFLAV